MIPITTRNPRQYQVIDHAVNLRVRARNMHNANLIASRYYAADVCADQRTKLDFVPKASCSATFIVTVRIGYTCAQTGIQEVT